MSRLILQDWDIFSCIQFRFRLSLQRDCSWNNLSHYSLPRPHPRLLSFKACLYIWGLLTDFKKNKKSLKYHAAKSQKTETTWELALKKIVKGWSPILSQLYSLDSAMKDENPTEICRFKLGASCRIYRLSFRVWPSLLIWFVSWHLGTCQCQIHKQRTPEECQDQNMQ